LPVFLGITFTGVDIGKIIPNPDQVAVSSGTHYIKQIAVSGASAIAKKIRLDIFSLQNHERIVFAFSNAYVANCSSPHLPLVPPAFVTVAPRYQLRTGNNDFLTRVMHGIRTEAEGNKQAMIRRRSS
jgi:hypothetical protein